MFNLSPERFGVCAIIAGAALVMLYYATANTPDRMIDPPEVQTEAQLMGLNVKAGLSLGNPGSPLDMSAMHQLHFWSPGWSNSGTKLDDHPVVVSPHRYPVVPGGNLSTVMHKGWSQFAGLAPANDDWRLNPPEVAIL